MKRKKAEQPAAHHTAGEWEVVEHTGTESGIYAGGKRIAGLECDDELGVQEMGANARLMAASPDLLAAAEGLLYLYPDLPDLIPGNLEKPKARRVLQNIRDAVAKARGGDKR